MTNRPSKPEKNGSFANNTGKDLYTTLVQMVAPSLVVISGLLYLTESFRRGVILASVGLSANSYDVSLNAAVSRGGASFVRTIPFYIGCAFVVYIIQLPSFISYQKIWSSIFTNKRISFLSLLLLAIAPFPLAGFIDGRAKVCDVRIILDNKCIVGCRIYAFDKRKILGTLLIANDKALIVRTLTKTEIIKADNLTSVSYYVSPTKSAPKTGRDWHCRFLAFGYF